MWLLKRWRVIIYTIQLIFKRNNSQGMSSVPKLDIEVKLMKEEEEKTIRKYFIIIHSIKIKSNK